MANMNDPDQPLPIEDYGLIGDCASCALVGLNGSIDWLCWPRFDSGACFAALLGDSGNGRWKLAPVAEARATRRYQDNSMILETEFTTGSGTVVVIDFMVPNSPHSSVVRIVEGRLGTVDMATEIALRFDYGMSVPWVTRLDDDTGICAIAGPEMVVLRTAVELEGRDLQTVGRFSIAAGERACFVMTHAPSHQPPPPAADALEALRETERTWVEWCARCTYHGEWREAVLRSLMVLKTLTYNQTGGIVAAATTSLPEQLGGVRNWDYRFCWLRDATLTLFSLMHAGYYEEAGAWRDWLHRAIAGSPSQIQIMYGIAGERRLAEWEVPWLAGYQGATPVRVGNAASDQLQLDVYGEVMSALHLARAGGIAENISSWELQRGVVAHLAEIWREPDEGIWETRGGRRNFTFSKVMAWVAFDAMIQDAEAQQLEGPVEEWRAIRDEIHNTVCREGFDAAKNSFVQSFGSTQLDASLLLIPLVGFLPHDDPRVLGTIEAIERELVSEGFVLRYTTTDSKDGLPPGEGAFLACSFWLADCLHMQGRPAEARAMFERLLALRNDLGLLSEEYDPRAKRLVGNMPQAFSHTALIGSAMNLSNGGAALKREAVQESQPT
jgi:GH15 family glucan-1,4-alpha-glucosidase